MRNVSPIRTFTFEFSFVFKGNDDHLALYGRAKVYIALKQFAKALEDVERVISLKPHWGKVGDFFFLKAPRITSDFSQGYYCRSEIFFEMKRFTAALLSSLQGLTLDPENRIGKQIMAQVNHHQSSFTNTHFLFSASSCSFT